jgi:hypothetical protein
MDIATLTRPHAHSKIDKMRNVAFGVPVLIAAFALVFASAAAADQPSTATFTYTATGLPTVTDMRTAGPNTFVTESVPVVYGGDMSGPYVIAGTIAFNSDGSLTAHGTTVCTGCTVGGRTGDFTTVFDLRGPSLFFGITGHFTITSASGGLAGLHGTADYAGNALGGTGTLSYHFDA